MFGKFYSRKTAWVTGHTGFKGSWLSAWLHHLGAQVTGLALDPPSSPSHFTEARLADLVKDHRQDIRDADAIRSLVQEAQPDFVFHLAAQPIVRLSYTNPLKTYHTNVL